MLGTIVVIVMPLALTWFSSEKLVHSGGLMMKYSRRDESQADEVGAIILYKAGYSLQAMAGFFENSRNARWADAAAISGLIAFVTNRAQQGWRCAAR